MPSCTSYLLKPPNVAHTSCISFSFVCVHIWHFHFVGSDPRCQIFTTNSHRQYYLLYFFLQKMPQLGKKKSQFFIHCKEHHLFKVKVQCSLKSKTLFCKYKVITKSKLRTKLVSATGFPVVVLLLISHIISLMWLPTTKNEETKRNSLICQPVLKKFSKSWWYHRPQIIHEFLQRALRFSESGKLQRLEEQLQMSNDYVLTQQLCLISARSDFCRPWGATSGAFQLMWWIHLQ